jgi:hypothetical protein
MLAAAAVAASHPAVAAVLGLGTAGLAAAVVAMAWNVNARQIRLAEQLARRQFIVTGQAGVAAHAPAAENGAAGELHNGVPAEPKKVNGSRPAPQLLIDGPETVVTGEQARYRVRPQGNLMAVSWAAGGGSMSQSPDPSHPDELLLVADQPGSLMITARVREGMSERRLTKPVTAVPDVTEVTPPFALRLFLHGWGLVAVAVLITGFAGALAALGTLSSADFIGLVSPLAALLAVVAVTRGNAGCPRAGEGYAAGTAKRTP